jgi:hypothetical protein
LGRLSFAPPYIVDDAAAHLARHFAFAIIRSASREMDWREHSASEYAQGFGL